MSKQSPSALVMAGGTGGHIFPALAVADALRAKGFTVTWLGTKQGMEAKLVPQRGYAIEWISFGGLRGKGVLRLVLMPLMILRAFWQSLRVLRKLRPDVVLGMGGYATFPGGMMASLTNRPLLIQEQNSIAGLTNRVLALVADRVLSGFPQAFEAPMQSRVGALLPRTANVIWSGNPVRDDIAALPLPGERFAGRSGALQLLVIGGSLGAKAINDALPAALALLEASERPAVTHQSGQAHEEALRSAYRQHQVDAQVVAFVQDMAARYADCDLLICRAGALTVAEIAAAGVASILIPFPFAVDDHQTGNARFLSEQGAAILLPQSELTPRRLADLLRSMTREKLLQMAQRARSLAKADATEIVARSCMELAHV